MKKLRILIHDNKKDVSEYVEAYPFLVGEDTTCFVQLSALFKDENCFKIKVCIGYSYETLYYPVSRYSIRHVEIFE